MNVGFYSPEKWLEIVRLHAPEAFITGSRAFGTATDSHVPTGAFSAPIVVSDTDVAILVHHREGVKAALEAMCTGPAEDSSYNNGFKFSTQHGTVNIVPLHPLDFVCWKLTTKHMRDIVAICPGAKSRISLRETKLGIFEALTGIHKMLIPYEGSDESEELAERIKA